MEGSTTHLLLGLISILIGALTFVLRGTMKRGDDILEASRRQLEASHKQTAEVISELRRAVDAFIAFRADTTSLSSKITDDLRAISETQERGFEELDAISRSQQLISKNQERILEILERMERKAS